MAITTVLTRGELGYDEYNNIAKIGDGETPFDLLRPFNVLEILDVVSSDSTTSALSANQGRILNTAIEGLSSKITALESQVGSSSEQSGSILSTLDSMKTDITTLKETVGITGSSTGGATMKETLTDHTSSISTINDKITTILSDLTAIKKIVGTDSYTESNTIPQRMEVAESLIQDLQTASFNNSTSIESMEKMLGTAEYTNSNTIPERIALNEENIDDLLNRAWVYGAYVASNA